MKSYGQFCPLAQATQLLCERWTLLIIRELIAGSTRFNALQKGVPLMSPTLLSSRLKQLLKAGVIDRKGSPGHYHYALTEAGLELKPVIELLGAWGHRWARSNLSDDDLDAGLLMWDMQRTLDTKVFPQNRMVVEFQYPDAPKGHEQWWLVSQSQEIDLCLDDPGHEVDIVIQASLKTMTAIWTCQLDFDQAVNAQDIKVQGPKDLCSKLKNWLRSSLLSRLGEQKSMPSLEW